MKYDKTIISKIAGIENWEEFEEFVKKLYSKSSTAIQVERNFRSKGASGRNREVDVRVTFGFNPHIITLGIECKYWAQKVDGDIIDIAVAKKEDLKLDKYAVITTVGFEAGAEIYAKSKGVDLFIIRPSNDDDFGYTGRIIKIKIHMHGSRPVDINLGGVVISEQGFESQAVNLLKSKLSNIEIKQNEMDFDADLDLYRYTKEELPDGAMIFTRQKFVKNLSQLLLETWQAQDTKFWTNNPCSIANKIIFKEPTALFLSGNTPYLINEINFNMHYLWLESGLEIDRSKQYPMILENIIERAVTPLSSSCTEDATEFTMCESMPKQEVDLSNIPDGVVGRGGVLITMRLSSPMTISSDDPTTKYYEFVIHEGEPKWVPIDTASLTTTLLLANP